MTPPARAIVLFDGVCNFCNAAVRFISTNDPSGRFAFLPLQSPRARALLGTADELPTTGAGDPATVVLLAHGRRYERSDAALHIALDLRAPWPLAFAAILIPRTIRDRAYDWFARNRYRWFGRKDECPLPPPDLRERFLDPDLAEPAP
jgi:predicted DCC family thiol-disulfide oxidoreductase YuxK